MFSSIAELPAQLGDLLVVATDGLFDNMFDEEIISFFEQRGAQGFRGIAADGKNGEMPSDSTMLDLQGIAQELALAAYARATDRDRISPFVRVSVLPCIILARSDNCSSCSLLSESAQPSHRI